MWGAKTGEGMKRLILTALLVFLVAAPAFSYDFQLSPSEDTFTDSLYINDVMGDEGGTHYQRLWAGPVINMAAGEEKLAGGIPTGIDIPGRDGTEFTHSYLKFDLSGFDNTITEAKLWLYRTPDDWGFPKNADTYPPDVYDDNPTYEYDKTCSGTITTSTASTAVTGVGTSFTTELKDGAIIRLPGGGAILGTIASIADDTHLTLTANAASDNAGIAFASHYYKYNDPDSGTIKVYYETNNGWSEATLKWKNEASGPNARDNIQGETTQIGPVGGWYYPDNKGWVSWDVTAFAQQAQATNEKILSLMIANDDAPYQTFHIFFSSESEAGTEALRPYLGVNIAPLIVMGTTYNHATRKLTITFNQVVDKTTFTAATLGNLSIQDGTTTVDLDGATIITTQDSSIMEATLAAADGTALDAIADNTLRLVVDAACGIKNLDAIELGSNTYASSTYPVSNTVITGTLKDATSSAVIANATVRLYDTSGNLKAQTVSDTNGNFSLYASVPDGNYNLVISKSPLFKEKTQPVTINGSALDAGTLLIDPYGIVYDAVTGSPISGATVTLYTASGNIYTGCPEPNPQSSRGDGSYNFNVAPGTYYLKAAKDGYADYTGANFVVISEIVEWNIPMNPNNLASSTYLSISKQANKKVVSAGDIITYTIDVKNISSAFTATNATINDILPQGFKYVPGSTFVDGVKAQDPTGTRNLSWTLGTLNMQTAKKLTYRVRVGTEARVGESSNSASISATVNGSTVSSGPSIATVEVRDGLFSDKGLLIGKVFEDINGNGIQDNYEPGIPGVSLILEDGTVIVTDEFGRYSVPNIDKGSHVIRLDQRVLPGGPFFKTKEPSGKQEDKKDTAAAAPLAPKAAIGSLPAPGSLGRESLIDRRRLDDWRWETLGRNQPQEKEDAASEVAEGNQEFPPVIEAKPRVPSEAAAAPQECAYSYFAKDKDGENVIGMLEAGSEAEVAEILHQRGLDIVSIAREEEEAEVVPVPDKKAQPAPPAPARLARKPASGTRSPLAELLNKYGDQQKKKPRGEYRSDIPKESRFFKIFGSETAKVNFPVRFLSQEQAAKEAEKDKAPNQFMLVGLADATVGYLNGKGNISNLESGVNTPYEDGTYREGRIKLYLKGLVKGEYLLTAAVDTDKEKTRHLFKYVNPEKYYPIYGDGSSYFNEAESRGKFYVRIDKNDSFGLWGNYNTQEFTKTEFGRYNRTLSGAKAHVEAKDWVREEAAPELLEKTSVDFFYALSEQEQVSQTFAAKGISGPFWLGKTPLLEYSESIRLETRDKDRSDVVLYTRTLTREIDYEIDFDTGRIFFKEPIPTRDGNEDPNYIVVDYEYVPLSGESKYYVAGTRVSTKLFNDRVSLGGQFIGENHVMNNPRLYGFDTVFAPDATTRLAAEWANSDRYLDSDSNAFLKQDNAWKIEASKILGKLRMQGYYSDIGNSFRNTVNVTEKGLEKYGATADYQLTDATNVVLDHWRSLSTISRTFDRQSSVDLYHKKETYFLGAGYAFKEYQDRLGLTPDQDIDALRLQAGRKLSERLVATLEEEYENEGQSGSSTPVDNKTYTTTGRLDYRVAKDATVYIKNRFIKELHNRLQNISSLGFSRATPDGEAYIEYGFGGKTAETVFGLRREQSLSERLTLSSYMNNVVSGDKNEENVGFGSSYEILSGLFTRFNFENSRTKNSDTSYYKENAQSVAFDYLPAGTENSYGLKFERRRASSTQEINAFGYAKHCLSKEFSLILDSEYLTERSSDESTRINRKMVLGLAYRPVYNDKLNLLSKYEYNDELNHATSSSSTDYYNNILSLEADYQLNTRLDLFGKYALKFQRERDSNLQTDSMIDMITTKATYKINDILDIASYYRFINEQDSRIRKQAPAVELGVLVLKRLRCGLGYNFLDYEDKDNSSEEYSGIGPYFNLGAKF